ncbi:MAG TPA: AI-2E family transporter [Candidatus Rubrimentiphilum sp.]|nr:AI-2E family transporter [Candidatus Rubrimentiphilum sp.]
MHAKDLNTTAPRRWSEELGGIRWLPRLIDKARAAIAGSLGDYLYGQSPIDRGLLRALGLTYRDFTGIVRAAGDDDDAVLAALQKRVPEGVERARKWSERLPLRHRSLLFLIDLDDGHNAALRPIRGFVHMLTRLETHYIRYRWPAEASLIGLEIEAQKAGERAAAASGTDEEPYRWLTAQNVDMAWKILLSIVLIGVMLYYAIHFVERIGFVAFIIIGAIFFAYLIYPLVRWLNRKLHLILAILVVYAIFAAVVAIGLSYGIPAISGELTRLTHDGPMILAKTRDFLTSPSTPVLGSAPDSIRRELAQLPAQAVTWFQQHGGGAAAGAVTVILGTAAFLGSLIAIPVLAAYLLFDSEIIKRFFMGFVPERRREATLGLLAELEEVLGGFIRGQLLVGATIGIIIAAGLMIFRVPYAILIGAGAGALDLIPYIGPVIAFIPALIIGFSAGGTGMAVKVAVVFLIANQLEGHVIAPNIVSRTIKLSPSAIVVAVLIGGELYGVPGMFIAVPIAGIIRVLLLHVIPGSVSREEARPVLTKESQETVEADAQAQA